MKFGIHYLMSCSDTQSPAQRYQDSIEQAVQAENLGFESVWPVEQHFNQVQSALPCPTLLLAAIAARTTTLRLGTAIIQLPLNHPLRIAEEIATLDVLSGGRVEFGVGRGSNPAHFAGFNVPLSESRDRMEESLSYIHRAFTQQRFSFQGKFYNAQDVCLTPKPVQYPHPPITVAVNSADSARFAGRVGYPIVIALHINPYPKAKELISIYKNTLIESGHPPKNNITILMPMYVGKDEVGVKQEVEPAVNQFINLSTTLISSNGGKWASQAENQHMELLLERIRQTTYESMNKGMAIFSTPAACVEQLKKMEEELGVDRVICWFNLVGAISSDKVMASMKLFSKEVIPHFV